MENKEIDGQAHKGDNRCILTLQNKIPFLLKGKSCTNMLAIYLLIDVASNNNTSSHVKCLMFFCDINTI